MDSIQKKVELRKAQVLQNINSSLGGTSIEKGEAISVEEFKGRLEKGEKFLTPADLGRFNDDVKDRVVKAYNPEDKELIRKAADNELAQLTPVTVQNEFGKKFNFFTKKEVQE
jgi:hypothetical protein